jgi:hypothetical protein
MAIPRQTRQSLLPAAFGNTTANSLRDPVLIAFLHSMQHRKNDS